jgi:phosphomannomutase
MSLKFGTSGLRGLVVEMTPDLILSHVAAFLGAFPEIKDLYVGRDLRPSSPRIAEAVMVASLGSRVNVIDCGALPTPALALASLAAGGGAIMVTGSHIPADRNGLKFYTPRGEISKKDEVEILAHLGRGMAKGPGFAIRRRDPEAGGRFVQRYVSGFGPTALKGQRIGHYAHSSVGRDLLAETLTALGADVVELARSDVFIPVDTEAVDADTRARVRAWAAEYRLDGVVSTDGDADRPMLADETGAIIPGDLLGQITSVAMGAEVAVTPVSSNSGAEADGRFARVIRTRIGSPYVIAGMEAAGGKVVGYEANGGYLLGFTAQGPAGAVAPLWTRDCFLPLIVPLMQAQGSSLSALAAAEPGGVTRAERLTDIPTEMSGIFVARLAADSAERKSLLADVGANEAALDLTDGVRMTLSDGAIFHIRPSGNAPELRLYVEASTPAQADQLLQAGLARLAQEF